MQAPRYETATVGIYDPVAMNRNATRNVLYSLGFREIEGFSALDDLGRAMSTREFDLVVLEAVRQDDAALDFTNRIRRSEVGRNPFAVILVSTWLPEAHLVRKALNAGADDLLCRPYSTSALGERLRTHVHARKGFIVTADYIGPDRRTDAARPNSAKLIEVINPLKTKAVDGKSGFEAQSAIQAGVSAGRRVINRERMTRAAFQIGVIAGFVRDETAQSLQNVRRSDLEKIIATAEGLMTLARQEQAEQAMNTCSTVIDVARKALKGNDLPSNSQLLVRLSVALQVMLSPGRAEEELHAELDETLERIRARGRVA